MGEENNSFKSQMEQLMAERETLLAKQQQSFMAQAEALKKLDEEFTQQREEIEKNLSERELRIIQKEEILSKREKELDAREKYVRSCEQKLLAVAMQENDFWRVHSTGGVGASDACETNTEPAEVEPVVEETVEKQLDSELPEMTLQYEKAVRKVFPKENILEVTAQRVCCEVGDKEVRVLFDFPARAMILVKREKTAQLKKGIAQYNRMQSEWEFDMEGSYLTATMHFSSAMPAEAVMKKCKEAIKEYFN